MDQEVIVRAMQIVKKYKKFHNLANSDWVKAQQRDLVIPHMIAWINWPKDDKRNLAQYLDSTNTLISDYDKHFYVARQKEFVIHDNLLNVRVTPTNSLDSAPVFVVAMGKHQTTIDVCHNSAGHQGRDHTLSLMKERFWWLGMSQALIKAVANCGRCIQYEAKGQLPPMQPIVCTEPMELVHIDYVGMEVTVAARETGGEECTGGCRPFHLVCPGICVKKSYGKNDCSSVVQQLLFGIWLPTVPHVR